MIQVKEKADVNATDKNLSTGLHFAAMGAHLHVIKFLITVAKAGKQKNNIKSNNHNPKYDQLVLF
jgi:hypothetical protein